MKKPKLEVSATRKNDDWVTVDEMKEQERIANTKRECQHEGCGLTCKFMNEIENLRIPNTKCDTNHGTLHRGENNTWDCFTCDASFELKAERNYDLILFSIWWMLFMIWLAIVFEIRWK